MQGDFSAFHFDPHLHGRGVEPPAEGVLRNVSGVLHQQGRVVVDADQTDGALLELGWNGQAGRDIIGAGVCAVPSADPLAFRVEAALVSGDDVLVSLRPGRAWADGILTRLAGAAADPLVPVTRLATWFGPPLTTPLPLPDSIGDGVRDAVILEVSEEALHGFQYPEQLIEPALGGPDTSERAFVNFRIRLLRLGPNEDCITIRPRLQDNPATKGRLTASLAPVVAIGGDCPVAGGGGYTGFEHHLYRIEVADVPAGAPARFKWSQWNGGLVGRGRFDATTTPDLVVIDAGRAPIVHAGLTEFYLEALAYDALIGAWTVIYATTATLNTDHDLELAAPASFGTLPATTDPVFFRLWNGIADIADFTNPANPVELRDGIRLAFDAPAPGNYRPGDYWTFTVRAGDIANPQVLVDDAPPVGIVYHRVALAEINWTGRRNTTVSGAIEDCRVPFAPLTARKGCCSFVVGDGVTSFGDFNALEEAAAHLPAAGGELCLLPGVHRANLRLEGRHNVTIHGCARRSLVLPRAQAGAAPVFHFIDCVGIRLHQLDVVTYAGTGVLIDGTRDGQCRDVRIDATRMVARIHCIRANGAAGLQIDHNRLHLLDTAAGLTAISLAADDSLVERNTLVLLPFIDTTPDAPDIPDDDPTRDPADPCARPDILYLFPHLILAYVNLVWTMVLALLVWRQPYRALGGIHVRAGSERVRLLDNIVVGGAGNGIVLGGDIDPPAAPDPEPDPDDTPPATVDVDATNALVAVVQDEAGAPQANVDVYLEAGATVATGRTNANGKVGIKAPEGHYLITVTPGLAVRKVSVMTGQDRLVYLIVVGPRAPDVKSARGFLHQVTIEGNDVSLMGLSGIGFALRAGAVVAAPPTPVPAGAAKDTLLAYIDAALFNLALTPLLRATHPVRDLVVLNNRLHHNLRTPFTEAMLADAQVIGRGGISLAVVDGAALRGNTVTDNGADAADPACGIFVGWGNAVEVSDNTLAANGAITAGYEDNRRGGLRGGVYVRFAGALSARLSTSTGRVPALRVHDNRIDQPAGRALTAFTFGPVSVANNHFSSQFTGRFGFIDAAVGCVLLMNLGGIHRLIARIAGTKLDKAWLARADAGLPGGETLYDDNLARLDAANRSLISQAILCLDDVSYASNTSAVLRGDPFFCNTTVVGDMVRASGGRLREDASHTLSLLTLALRANFTTHNQADHCIFAFPVSTGPHLPRTVDGPNHVLDATFCSNAAGGAAPVGLFAAPALSAYANQLGGAIEPDTFSGREVATLGQRYTVTAVAHVATTQVALTRAYQVEAKRLEAKLGPSHPTVIALNAQAEAAVGTQQILVAAVEAGGDTPPDAGSSVEGRLLTSAGQGAADYTVELVEANGRPAAALGQSNADGKFSASFDAAQTSRLAALGKLFPRVLDVTGREVLRSEAALVLEPGAHLQVRLVLPHTVRTPLERLQLDPVVQQQLQKGGIDDVEEILETAPRDLAELLGSVELADRVIAMAKRLLG